jgi:hypothetical protein
MFRPSARRCYDAILAEGLAFHEAQAPLAGTPGVRPRRGRKARRTGHNLIRRLIERKQDTLRFLHDAAVPLLAGGPARSLVAVTVSRSGRSCADRDKRKFQLLGLFRGVGLPFQFESAPMRMPNMIWLYRRPILAYWSTHQDTLEAIIAHVLVHEIGHHFGFSDDDMHGIEDRAD